MDATNIEPSGSLAAALAHASRLLQSAPELAIEQAVEILKVVPGHPAARLILGMGSRAAGMGPRALECLEALAAEQPRWAAAHHELGLARAEAGQTDAALAALRTAVTLQPAMADAWRAIGDLSMAAGDGAAADAAYAEQIKASTQDPRLLAAAAALCRNDLPEAETRLREHLKRHPTDVAAIRMFAEVAGRLGRFLDAGTLLERCLELAPSFHAARHNYAIVLHRQNRPAAALEQIERLADVDARNPAYRNLRAMVLARIGEYRESIEIYADILRTHPLQAAIWMSYGHALSVAGREQDGIAAYRRCIALEPSCGEAYWSLANLKTFRFDAAELAAMAAALENADLGDEERFHFEFAIAKALEDVGRHAESFAHYAAGNRLRRAGISYSAEETSAHVRRSKALLTAEFFAARRGWGVAAADPVFIVGLPRAGSTLIEQILASHSQVEGTMELPNIMAMAKRLGREGRDAGTPGYPEALAALSAADCRLLGEEYLDETRIQRKTGKPFFIDKMPNNFLHIGLIALILPNARIIDARRHPMACCFSGFKQHFARGQNYTYDLRDIGRFYVDYVDLMRHFDAVLPGRIHRVIYESMIEDTAAEVAGLLDHCGLPFEAGCLRFYENDRAVRTASSQQVRKPIFKDGVDQWRHFEAHLGPLREALGNVVDHYPQSPPL
jgi:tetratricopeptide (TPR) repeat protein